MSLLACQCVIEMQKKLGNYDTGISGFKLRLHAGISAGKIAGIHVGGAQGRLEFFIAGDPIDKVQFRISSLNTLRADTHINTNYTHISTTTNTHMKYFTYCRCICVFSISIICRF
jgi:hypothetical protein